MYHPRAVLAEVIFILPSPEVIAAFHMNLSIFKHVRDFMVSSNFILNDWVSAYFVEFKKTGLFS